MDKKSLKDFIHKTLEDSGKKVEIKERDINLTPIGVISSSVPGINMTHIIEKTGRHPNKYLSLVTIAGDDPCVELAYNSEDSTATEVVRLAQERFPSLKAIEYNQLPEEYLNRMF